MIPPVSGGAGDASGRDPDPGVARGALHRGDPRRARGPAGRARGRRVRRVPRPDPLDARDTRPGAGSRGGAPRRPSRGIARVRGPRRDGAGRPGDDRRRGRRPGSACVGWRSCIGRARCRWASRRSRSRPPLRTATRPSPRLATRSTRPRHARRSGRPSGSPTATSGSATRHEPARQAATDSRGLSPTDDRRRHTVRVTDPWGPTDRLVQAAEALAGAWGGRARACTTVGQERAILRLFGVHGLDAAGAPLAGSVVNRWLAGEPERRWRPASPCRSRWPCSSTTWSRSSSPATWRRAPSTWRSRRRSFASRTGGPSPRSRPLGWPPPRSSGSTPSGRSATRRSPCSATRRGPGWERRSGSPTRTSPSTRPRPWSPPAST